MHHRRTEGQQKRGGYTLLELTFSVMIYVVILLSTLGMLERDTRLSQSVLSTTHVEQMAQELIFRLKDELANAQGANPMAIITEDLDHHSTDFLRVDSTLGFPSQGTLVLDRGTPLEERLAYSELDNSEEYFRVLARGQNCTEAKDHLTGSELIWGGLAEPIALQENPSVDQYDGLAMGVLGPVYFRGDGTGFAYRKPVDPSGGTDLMEGDKLKWGSVVSNVPTLDGWSALAFQPRYTFSEEKTGHDINNDGDKLDVFDVGVIGRRRWVAGDTDWDTDEINMGPSAVMQEQCNWGSDLDGDGFDDPIFLWNKDTRQLQLSLFVIGGIASGNPIIRKVESTVFLRNEVEI